MVNQTSDIKFYTSRIRGHKIDKSLKKISGDPKIMCTFLCTGVEIYSEVKLLIRRSLVQVQSGEPQWTSHQQ